MSNLNDQLADMLETYGKIKMANEISSAINNLAASNMADRQVEHTYVTEWDKNLHAIAETRAECFIRLHRGICTIEKCRDCQTFRLHSECYDALTSCDKLKVDNEQNTIVQNARAQEAQQKAQQKALERQKKDDNAFTIFLVVMVIVVIVISFIAFSC